ncbi:MAG TPA: urease accessory protein UreF [Burkholderiales bacterium]|nr:urease accessory protein UreF [Burkholderiales bacterium]
MNPLALTRLLQLASPTLPVGAYSYSQGLESAVESGIVTSAGTAELWISDLMDGSMARLEAPLWLRLHAAWTNGDLQRVQYWNDWFIAGRETAELRAETLQMGYSLRRLIFEEDALGMSGLQLSAMQEIAFPTVFSFASVAWSIAAQDALSGYVWSWLENQVMAALKTVPLGQSDGQRLLAKLAERIPALYERASRLADHELSNFLPGFAILSSAHETQYSRLFRS